MPKDVPNSTISRAPELRASMYSKRPVSRETGKATSFSRA